MPEQPAPPNDRDCEFLLYLIYSGDSGIPFDDFCGWCEHNNRWAPSESTLRHALNRLSAHGFAIENGGLYHASPAIREKLESIRNPEWNVFEEMDELAKLVVEPSQTEQA